VGRILSASARIACVGALAAYALWISSEDLLYRWENHLSRVWFGMLRDAGPIDLVATGSSRTAQGFDGFRFAAAYRARHGREPVVFDVSRFARGPEVDYLVLRRLLDRREVRHLLVEYQHGGLGSDPVHPSLELAAGFGEIAGVCWAEHWRPAWARAQRILDLWLKRASGLAVLAVLGDLPEIRVDPDDPGPARTRDPTRARDRARPARILGVADRAAWREAPPRRWDFDDPDAARDVYWARRIVALARERGIDVTFYHPNALYDPPLADGVAEAFAARIGAPLVEFPRELLPALYPEGYGDDKHLNAHGVSLWMDALAARLELP